MSNNLIKSNASGTNEDKVNQAALSIFSTMAGRGQKSGCMPLKAIMAHLVMESKDTHLASKYARWILSAAITFTKPEKSGEVTSYVPLYSMGNVNDKSQELCLELNPRAVEVWEQFREPSNSSHLQVVPH